MKVLVVDADEGVRRTLSSGLEAEGYAVTVAAGGVDGLSRALADRPDFIVYDLRVPDLNGLEFMDRYREAGGGAAVIVMYAYGSDAIALAAIQAGAYDVLPKPFTTDELVLTLRKAAIREDLSSEGNRVGDSRD
jgi:two-component system response regulator AtoC